MDLIAGGFGAGDGTRVAGFQTVISGLELSHPVFSTTLDTCLEYHPVLFICGPPSRPGGPDIGKLGSIGQSLRGCSSLLPQSGLPPETGLDLLRLCLYSSREKR